MRIEVGIALTLSCIFTAIYSTVSTQEVAAELRRAHKLCEGKKFQEASIILKKVCEQAPNFADAHCLLGHVYLKLGRQADARKALAQAVAHGRLTHDVLEQLAQIDRQQNQTIALLTGLRLRMLIEPKSREWSLFYADVLASAGALKEAEQVYKTMIKADCSRPDVFMRLGNLYLRQGKHRKAVSVFETAYYLGESNPSLPKTLAGLCYNVGDRSQALCWYERMLKLQENPSGRLLLRRVKFLLAAEEFDQAELAAKSLAKSENHDMVGKALFLLGQVAMRRNPKIAAGHWEAAVKSGIKEPKILAFLGSYYFNKGQYEKAIHYLGKCLAYGGIDKVLLRYLILGLIRSGKEKGAKGAIQTYLEHYGWDHEAQRLVFLFVRDINSSKTMR